VTAAWGGRRRVVWIIGGLAAALVFGRWAAVFITNRLWESRVSEAAALVGTRFALMSAVLEIAGLVVAIAWFAINLLLVVRSALRQFETLPHPLGTVPDRAAYAVVLAAALVVGIGVGGGTSQWLPAVLLAINGVTVGAPDPLLRIDLGYFLGELPLWELLHSRAVTMYLPGLLGVFVLAMMTGVLAVRDQRLWLAPRSRWHFAILLMLGALLVGWTCALEPYRLAGSRVASIGPAEFLFRATVAQVITLFAATAAVLTFLWGARLRFMVALGGWVILGLSVLGGTALIRSRAADGQIGVAALQGLRRLDTIAFGIRLAGPGPASSVVDLGPSLWDADRLARLAETDSGRVIDVLPGLVRVGSQPVRTWFVIRAGGGPGADPVLFAVPDDRIGPSGGALSLRWGETAFTPGLWPYLTLSPHSARPGAPEYDLHPQAPGVTLGSPAKRIAVAWARQIGAVLRAQPNTRLAWNLDPVARLNAVAPFARWTKPRVVVNDRETFWVSDGFTTAERFPASQTVAFLGAPRSYARAGFIGVVRARGGETQVYLRSDADSLSAAWGRIAAPLVEDADGLPAWIAADLGVSAELASLQARALQSAAWLGRTIAASGRQSYPVVDFAQVGTAADPHLVPLQAESAGSVGGLLVLPAGSDGASRLIDVPAELSVSGPRELQQRWDRFPFAQQLRDSIRAAGSDHQAGAIRFGVRSDTMFAFQPVYGVGPRGMTGVVMVNVALAQRLGAGRTYQEAWQNLRGEVAPKPVGSDLSARLEEARQWLDQADAALRRGDLAEFGRAFSYLRALLGPGSAPPTSRDTTAK